MKQVLAGAAFLLAGASAAHAETFTALYAFGDSLSDAGNVLIATGQPTAPYYDGRFSNGPNWVDDIAAAKGLGPVTPLLAGGNDYAFGGATTGPDGIPPSAGLQPPTVLAQVGFFLGTHATASPTALYTMWIGANDIFAALGDLADHSITPGQAVAATDTAVGNEVTAIKDLVAAGARRFIVPGVPPLGLTPQFNTTPLAGEASLLASDYDSALTAALATVSGAVISYIDTYDALNAIVADPGAFGFVNATQQCYSQGNFMGGGTACADPNGYVFWDPVHPTAAAAALTAEIAINDVPEPSMFGVLGLATIGVLTVARRRAT